MRFGTEFPFDVVLLEPVLLEPLFGIWSWDSI